MKKLFFEIKEQPKRYEMIIDSGLLSDPHRLKRELSAWGPEFALIADDTTAVLYGKALCERLRSLGWKAHLLPFAGGEMHKTRKEKERLEDQLLELAFSKRGCLLALGGGVTTDLTGFIAATYHRGISYVTIPTSLMGMVDASIGGKTAVNTPLGKNLIGSLYQPSKVLVDPSLLSSLPRREFKSGIVETIKHGCIASAPFFHYLQTHVDALLALDASVLEEVIEQSSAIKKQIVERDAQDRGHRNLLNWGHTVGHALELLTHYALSHGEAVAIGMLVEAQMAVSLDLLLPATFHALWTLLKRYEIPLQLPQPVDCDRLLSALKQDKKTSGGLPRFVLLQDIGRPVIQDNLTLFPVEERIVRSAIQWMNHALCCH
jgi:3-dehydroquinate synthase